MIVVTCTEYIIDIDVLYTCTVHEAILPIRKSSLSEKYTSSILLRPHNPNCLFYLQVSMTDDFCQLKSLVKGDSPHPEVPLEWTHHLPDMGTRYTFGKAVCCWAFSKLKSLPVGVLWLSDLIFPLRAACSAQFNSKTNNAGRAQQVLLAKWELYIQECHWSDYREISVLYEEVATFPSWKMLFLILSVGAKPPAQWGLKFTEVPFDARA